MVLLRIARELWGVIYSKKQFARNFCNKCLAGWSIKMIIDLKNVFTVFRLSGIISIAK